MDRSPGMIVTKTLRRAAAGEGCQTCGCTETRACPGGCGWDLVELQRGVLRCTRCTGGGPVGPVAA